MKECKYKLPCNWCDKFNKFCDMTEQIEIKLPDQNNCSHDWKIEQRIVFPPEDKNGKPYCVIKQVCRKCHEVEFVKDDIYD